MSAQSIPPTQNWKTLNGLSNIIRSFSINEDLLPAVTLVYSLGSAGYRWLNLHVQNIFATTADIGNIDCTTLTATGTVTMTGLSATNITASGILAGNSLSITTNGTINGNLTVGNDLYVTGSFDVGAFSCTSMVCTGSATFGASITATSITSTGSISGQAFSCTALTCSGAVSAATISAPTLTITGNTAMGGTTPALVTSAGLVTVQNATDVSLVNTNASITTAGGIYVAKSIRCVATVTAATYNGSGAITTSSNSLGFTQGTGIPTTASINYLSSTTEITGLLTCTGGITVSSGTLTTGAISATTIQTSGLLTCNAGLTVATGTTTTGAISATTIQTSGLVTCNAGLTVATGTLTSGAISATTIQTSGLLTCNAGLTVATGTTTTGAISATTIQASGLITANNGLTVATGTLTAGILTATSTTANPITFRVTSTGNNRISIDCVNASAGTPGISFKRGSTAIEQNVLFVDTSNNFAIYSNTIAADTFQLNNTTGAVTIPYTLAVQSSTNSTSFTTGAFRVTGGASITRTLYSYMYFGAFIANAAIFTNSNDSNQTYAIGDIYSLGLFGVYRRTGMTSIRVDTLPTPASIAAYTSVAIGTSLHFIVHNSSASDMNIDVPVLCTRITSQGTSTAGTISAGQHRRVTIVMTNVSSGTETYTAYV